MSDDKTRIAPQDSTHTKAIADAKMHKKVSDAEKRELIRNATKTPRVRVPRQQPPTSRTVEQDKRMKQGFQDVVRGVRDTSRAPEADQTYRRLKKL